MKRHLSIGFMLGLALLAACARPDDDLVETRRATSLQTVASPQLQAIDSLMWQQPDSALAVLMDYLSDDGRDGACTVSNDIHCDTKGDGACTVSTDETFDNHYANLLLAELLYKNYCEQTNRTELQQAVSYFDSLTSTLNDHPHASWRHGGLEPPSPERNNNLIFLDARAHYINGVGYYENDSMVEACKEYLKALEVMESGFEEKERVGIIAKLMTYIYNRLGDMFEEQFMIEPAIDCYKHSFEYSVISPISSYSVSNALYRMGKQYNMKGDRDSADYYYSLALINMPDSTNLSYRDIVSTKALLSYQLTHKAEASLRCLQQMVALAEDNDEKLTRYVVIGNIFFEENTYDSALLYLEPVLENKRDRFLQIRVLNYLRIIYDNLGNREKSNECVNYLAHYNETGAESSALVSQLSGMYKTYLSRKQEKEAVAKREVAVKKTLGIVISIAAVLSLAIIVAAKLKSRKLLKEQQEKANKRLGETEQQHEEELKQRQTEVEKMLEDKEKQHRWELEEKDKQHTETIETERQLHRMEQAALSGKLRRRNEEVRELKGQIKRQDDRKAVPMLANSFMEEPICRLIMERVNEGQFKAKIDCEIYKQYALDKQQLLDLRRATDRHFSQFTLRLRKAYPKLTNIDIDYCCLYLLNLTHADISALMQRAYNTVVERDSKIQKVFNTKKPLSVILMEIAQNNLSI